MVKYGGSGRAYRRQRGQHRPKGQPIDAVRFFFLSPSPFSTSSSLSQHEKEIKNKLSTDSPCFGPLSVGWSKEIIRELVKIVHNAEGDHENFGEASTGGSLEGLLVCRQFLWWDGRRRKTIEACSTFPEWVGAGEEHEKHSCCYPKKEDWAAKKWILYRGGKLSLRCCAIGLERKEN